LLLANLQKRKVSSAAYWYIDRDTELTEAELPSVEESFERVYPIAKKLKEAREKGEYECPKGSGGCVHCAPYEKILRGEAEFVGKGEYKQDLYLVS
jgi:hypothetical protein